MRRAGNGSPLRMSCIQNKLLSSRRLNLCAKMIPLRAYFRLQLMTYVRRFDGPSSILPVLSHRQSFENGGCIPYPLTITTFCRKMPPSPIICFA